MSHMKALLAEVADCMGRTDEGEAEFVGSLVLARLGDVPKPWDSNNPKFKTLVRNLKYQSCPCGIMSTSSPCALADKGVWECLDCGRTGTKAELAAAAAARRSRLSKGLSGGNGKV